MESRVVHAVDVVVVSIYHPIDIDKVDGDDDDENNSKRNDGFDVFNHPRKRRNAILRELYSRQISQKVNDVVDTNNVNIVFQTPTPTSTSTKNHNNNNNNINIDLYRKCHSDGLVDFLSTAWKQWDSLGVSGRDPSCIPSSSLLLSTSASIRTPPLIPCNYPLPRVGHQQQRRSKNVMGQIGYYCTDTCTPVFAELLEELHCDARIVSTAVDIAINNNTPNVVYALCTHPGHHAARDSFGGYCYVNNAALTARLLQERLVVSSSLSSPQQALPKVVILDVDYHCGNGTASIFYNDPNTFVISIHCHPDYEYPFHSGYGDETGGDQADGLTLYIPLLPGTTWDDEYKNTLQNKIAKNDTLLKFNPDAFILSLGLDTHIDDPCAIRRAGFQLSGDDYKLMGESIGQIITNINIARNGNSNSNNNDITAAATTTSTSIPTIVLQEGGYEMTQVPSAATDVVLGMACKLREFV
jgi:acetoin utilization deacetylase AcuC-like enzyme